MDELHAIRNDLKRMDKDKVIGLLAGLAGFKNDNMIWLRAKLYGKDEVQKSIEFYKKRISEAFKGEVKRSLARSAINDYRKVSGNEDGLIELLLFYVEKGTALSFEYGDMSGAFYASMENAYVDALVLIAKPENRQMIDSFRPRIEMVIKQSEVMGYGYHDTLVDYYEELILHGGQQS